MRYIYHRSDFEFYQELAIKGAPFEFTYYIQGGKQNLTVSFDGMKYNNCRPSGNGIIVSVDYSDVYLGIGKLRCTYKYYLNNIFYKDGIYEPATDYEVGIKLHEGATDDLGEIKVEAFPFYQKGDDGKSAYELWLEKGNSGTEQDFLESLKGADGEKGDKMTYDDLTEGEKDDLASRVEVPTKTSQLTNDSGYVTSPTIKSVVAITQADYDALETKDETTLYLITE